MKTIEKEAIGVFVTFLTVGCSQEQKVAAYLNKVLSELDISLNDIMKILPNVDKQKYYQILRQMNPTDKKKAQQYFANAEMMSHTDEAAFVLSEILIECNMFDAII